MKLRRYLARNITTRSEKCDQRLLVETRRGGHHVSIAKQNAPHTLGRIDHQRTRCSLAHANGERRERIAQSQLLGKLKGCIPIRKQRARRRRSRFETPRP